MKHYVGGQAHNIMWNTSALQYMAWEMLKDAKESSPALLTRSSESILKDQEVSILLSTWETRR